MKSIQVIAPAKVNLFLGVGPKRSDGFHQVDTVMHTLALHDRMIVRHLESGDHVKLEEPWSREQPIRQTEIEVRPGDGLAVHTHCVWMDGIAPEDVPSDENLATKAIYELAKRIGRSEDEYFRITIEKHIPSRAGMGGGSSDAAAALVATCYFWGIDVDDDAVVQTAQSLGADVCFFLHGGCAVMRNRGERVASRIPARKGNVVVIRPEGGMSTKSAYQKFDESPTYAHENMLQKVADLERAEDAPLFNNLEPASEVLMDELVEIRQWLDDADEAVDSLMCGSGSAVFAICGSSADATALVGRARLQGWWARSTMFSPVGAAKLPDDTIRW